MKLTKEQRARLEAMLAEAESIRTLAASEDRPMTSDESDKHDRIMDDYDVAVEGINRQCRADAAQSRLESIVEDSQRSQGRRADALPAPTQQPAGSDQPDVRTFQLHSMAQPVALEPGSDAYVRSGQAYVDEFRSYVANGQITAGLRQSDQGDGGVLAPMQLVTDIVKFLDDLHEFRQHATVLPPMQQAGSLGILTLETDPSDAEWTSEVPASALSPDSSMQFGSRQMLPHLLARLVKVSQRLVRGSLIPIESFIAERLAYKFALAEEAAFMTGSGAGQPLGIFTATADGIPTSRDVTAAATAFTADEVIDVKFSVKAQYWANGRWVMHRDVLKAVRQLKDGNGQYLYQPGLAGNGAGQLLDSPIILSEEAPNTVSASNYAMVYGDLRHYVIADSMMFEIQRLLELFAATNQVGIIGRKETDGMPVVAEAFARLIRS